MPMRHDGSQPYFIILNEIAIKKKLSIYVIIRYKNANDKYNVNFATNQFKHNFKYRLWASSTIQTKVDKKKLA